jgi:tetratricopeptide (TPR) repeat protein
MGLLSNLRFGGIFRGARELEADGRLDEARAEYERVAAGADGDLRLAALLRAGMIATGQNELLKAKEHFDRAKTLHPSNATAWLHYANACFRLLDTGSADEAFHEALKHAPDRPDILYHQSVYYGDRMAKAGLAGARRAALGVFDLLDKPGGAAALEELAFNRELPMIYIRNFSVEKQLPDDGLAALGEFAARPPGQGTGWVRASALNHIGLLLANTGRYDDAIERYGEALLLTPDFVEVRFNRGMTHVRRHAWDDARADFSEYAKRHPKSPVGTFGMALLAETKGDVKESARLYRFFLDRIQAKPMAPAELAHLDIARSWIDHAKTWLDALDRASEGGLFEREP